MNRSEKKAFRAIIEARSKRNLATSSADATLLTDYLDALSRIEVLRLAFQDDTAIMRRTRDGRVKARLVSTSRQIDAATRAAQQMFDRLLPPSGG
jgi:hypothetical protein